MIADEAAVRDFLARDPAFATARGGPFGWDALTYLCFSRYLRLDGSKVGPIRPHGEGASRRRGECEHRLDETIDTPPRQIIKSAIYGAAGVAHTPV